MNTFFCSLLSLELVLALSTPGTLKTKYHPVTVVDSKSFDSNKHYFHSHSNGDEYETPVLIKDALSKRKCEEACNRIVDELSQDSVMLQRKTSFSGDDGAVFSKTGITEVMLMDALAYMMESRHDDSFFCFSEGLMDGKSNLDETIRMLRSTKESLFGASEGCALDCKNDLFQFFPDDFKPSDCLVIAGEGATSTLHRDPYTWTGTSLCLEGTKIWRFIAPPGALSVSDVQMFDSDVKVIDDAVKSYRLPSVAWENNTYLSSGWQSDMSLFSHRKHGIRSAESFAALEEQNPSEKYAELKSLALGMDGISPSLDFPSELLDHVHAVVQEPGDLLIIPAFWWHQTYAPEPSIAVASQRAGKHRDVRRVIMHILDTVGLEPNAEGLPFVLNDVLKDKYNGSLKEISRALFQYLANE